MVLSLRAALVKAICFLGDIQVVKVLLAQYLPLNMNAETNSFLV